MFEKKEYYHFFDNKNEFNEKFSKYLNRDWMYINGSNFDEFKKLIDFQIENGVLVKYNGTQSDVIVPDGVGIVKASKMIGCPVKERITGIDIAIKLAEIYHREKDRKAANEVISSLIKNNPKAQRDRRVLKYQETKDDRYCQNT